MREYKHIFQSNSRCCCKETPSTAGWNQDYFYPHFIQKWFSKKLCHAIYALDTQRNPDGTAYACALAINMHISHNIHLHEISVLLAKKKQQQLYWFQYSAGKNIMISSCRFLTATSAIDVFNSRCCCYWCVQIYSHPDSWDQLCRSHIKAVPLRLLQVGIVRVLYSYKCDMIKVNESDVGNIDFELQVKIGHKCLYIL